MLPGASLYTFGELSLFELLARMNLQERISWNVTSLLIAKGLASLLLLDYIGPFYFTTGFEPLICVKLM